jgi:protein phosphatase
MSDADFRVLLDAYLSSIDGDAVQYANHQSPFILPEPNPDLLKLLFRHTQTLFQNDPVLLEITSPCIIIGDIHGQILDLLRILNTFGNPSPLHYLFLGDLVDRGEFSLETLVIPLLLKSLWPDSVFVIRGNHEFRQLCSQSGFLKQMTEIFNDATLYDDALRIFRELPFAARIDNAILCVHGGIGPNLLSVDQIRFIQRPIEDFGDVNINSLVWSDPSDKIATFEPSVARGVGFIFGALGLTNFLERSKLDVLVRAHECVSEGYEAHFDSRCLTIFSASNYGMSGNRSAVLEVKSAKSFKVRDFPALPWFSRKDVVFKTGGKTTVLRSRRALGLCPKLSLATDSGASLFAQKRSTSVALPRLGVQDIDRDGSTSQPSLLHFMGTGRRFGRRISIA